MIPQAPKIDACLTCGSRDFSRAPSGHCADVDACTARRVARTKPRVLEGMCIVKMRRYGRLYFLQEFAAASQDPKFVIDPPRHYYQAVLEENGASDFPPAKAMLLAKEFNGWAVEK